MTTSRSECDVMRDSNEPDAPQVIDKATLNKLMVRLDTLQHNHQRQIDDLRERLRLVEENLAVSSTLRIDWDRTT